jgi:hypothetical protein
MNSDMAVMTIPAGDELFSALETGCGDRSLAQSMYYALSAHAGTEKVGPGLVLMLVMALHTVSRDYPPVMFVRGAGFIDGWIKAIAANAPQVQQDALDHWALIGADYR